MVTTVLKYTVLIVAVAMTIIILLQGGRADGLTSALGGSKNLELFSTTKSRGSDIWMDRITFGLALAFMVIVSVLRVL
jgi:preprotein translocase subunit SecG